MTTETKELTEEMVAEALGRKTRKGWSDTQELYGCLLWNSPEYVEDDIWEDCPDFLNDLNASWKYVWPELCDYFEKRDQRRPNYGSGRLAGILMSAFLSDNPAMYLATKFMELKSANEERK